MTDPLMRPLDPASTAPPFEQLRRRIAEAARTGELAVGTRLPTVRALAESLSLAANTVARAYRELEQEGVVATHGRAGTFIAATNPAAQEAAVAASAFADRVTTLGFSTADALALARAALEARRPG
ncbi:GntR family transcriptional regulator [Leifsonia poae]|uniref:GntR family transcriptional regulator n=1 Tax=Leifsonia poae TaxID=110933 RepID=UPI001CC0C662|nr:GntR family transcriptional regulator [Leifsonia poae]